NCDSNVQFWNVGERVFPSLIASIGTAQALTTINKLGCWLAKESNATSAALQGLLMYVNSIRHATLQNRAAIDFLLLAQGHGCQDFEGMCCMNLSDHSESIHASIEKLQALTQQLKLHSEEDFFGFLSWFGNLEPWVKKLVILCLLGIFVIFL
ncbi:hypothetical protein N324_04045, partial [Chlamydotis macqueenii]